MSPKQWFSLLAFYISYLFFGASVFYHGEHRMETERRAVAHAERIEINGNYFSIDIVHGDKSCCILVACGYDARSEVFAFYGGEFTTCN